MTRARIDELNTYSTAGGGTGELNTDSAADWLESIS
jgi:hypothetical protein